MIYTYIRTGIYSSLFIVPSAPPDNFRGYNTSSTSIFVQWDQVPAAGQNGVILNYTIKYIETDSSGSETIFEKTVVVVAPKRNVTLEKLNEYKIYKITVAASTSKGKGRESEPPLEIRTEQDSKLFFYYAFHLRKDMMHFSLYVLFLSIKIPKETFTEYCVLLFHENPKENNLTSFSFLYGAKCA